MVRFSRWSTLLVLWAASGIVLAGDSSLYPYKTIGNLVFFQRYSNAPMEPVVEAQTKDFKLIYKNQKIAIGYSNGRYYCDNKLLPAGLEPSKASVLDSFLMTNVGSFAYCKPTVEIKPDEFAALHFPFFRNGKQILLVTGDVLNGADATSFRSVDAQGYDKQHYYFVAEKKKTIPYHQSVKLYEHCYGMAKIDGAIYFKGDKQADIDSSTFTCLDFYTVADKKGFIIDGRRAYAFSEPVDTSKLKRLGDNVVSDGQSVWFTGLEPYQFKGMDAMRVTVKDNTISDGKQTWRCQNYKQGDQPMCTQQ